MHQHPAVSSSLPRSGLTLVTPSGCNHIAGLGNFACQRRVAITFFSAGSKTMSSSLIQGMTMIEVRDRERRPLHSPRDLSIPNSLTTTHNVPNEGIKVNSMTSLFLYVQLHMEASPTCWHLLISCLSPKPADACF